MKTSIRNEGLEALGRMAYPGRVVIIGKSSFGNLPFVAYGITGRSPSSQARCIKFEETRAMVLPTDEELLKTGDPELLLYPAIVIGQGIAVVSNGRQTSSIRPAPGADMGPAELLARAMEDWDYEPDAPNFTPRISGCILSPDRAALSIIKRGEDGGSEKDYFEFPLLPGRARMISTYSGENVNPLPSFQGEPRELRLEEGTARDTAEAVYEALGPVAPPNDDDFRVAAVCVYLHDLEAGTFEEAVVNRHERNKK